MDLTYDLSNSVFRLFFHKDRGCETNVDFRTLGGVGGELMLDEAREWFGVEFQVESNQALGDFLKVRPFAVERTWRWGPERAVFSTRAQGFNLVFCEEGLHGLEIQLLDSNEDIGLEAFEASGRDVSSVFPWRWSSLRPGPVTNMSWMTRKGLSRSGFFMFVGGGGVLAVLMLTSWKTLGAVPEAGPNAYYLIFRLGASILGGMGLMGGLWLLVLGLFRKKRA